ncbi:Outer membrane protein transport protein (OMPP1/FadL/TodX) [Ferrimonas sediminum]|uniref:Outer membrane protein transport protein (OMPP1/FadL/TodX) n=1 Tax=Ferrimonas sediminum TaxID=718193 RepID=A0A1G9BGC9_9GAMM|nr:outer membrane protein transport protein [Ferrimonas sediminum]SDK38104.1 Outer membrane protein transport protein (OMPP1/FadL/TodX) [Ferrimonas sediminum]
MKFRRSPISCLMLSICSFHAAASGILRDETASAYLGSAGAGRAADIGASAAFNNPAGLTYLDHKAFQGTLLLVEDTFTFHDNGSSGNNADFDQRKKDTDYGKGFSGGGSLFYGQPLGEKWGVGFAFASPAGGATDFGDNWIGSNFIESVEVMVAVAVASVGYRINDQWSVGLSAGISYMAWELDMDPFPGASENLDLDSFEPVWSVSVMYQPWSHTRLGLRYTPGVTHEVTGKTTMTTPMGTLIDHASQEFNLADQAVLSLDHQLTPKLSLLADVEWAQWSDWEESRIIHDNGPTIVVDRDWKDAWSAGIGLSYQVAPDWTLKAGIAYDESSVSKAIHKLDPPADRQIAYAAGLGWQLSDSTRFDLSYQYMDLGDVELNQSIEGFDPIAGAPFSQQIVGQSEAHLHIVNLSLSKRF